jgi:hypothetical protein
MPKPAKHRPRFESAPAGISLVETPQPSAEALASLQSLREAQKTAVQEAVEPLLAQIALNAEAVAGRERLARALFDWAGEPVRQRLDAAGLPLDVERWTPAQAMRALSLRIDSERRAMRHHVRSLSSIVANHLEGFLSKAELAARADRPRLYGEPLAQDVLAALLAVAGHAPGEAVDAFLGVSETSSRGMAGESAAGGEDGVRGADSAAASLAAALGLLLAEGRKSADHRAARALNGLLFSRHGFGDGPAFFDRAPGFFANRADAFFAEQHRQGFIRGGGFGFHDPRDPRRALRREANSAAESARAADDALPKTPEIAFLKPFAELAGLGVADLARQARADLAESFAAAERAGAWLGAQLARSDELQADAAARERVVDGFFGRVANDLREAPRWDDEFAMPGPFDASPLGERLKARLRAAALAAAAGPAPAEPFDLGIREAALLFRRSPFAAAPRSLEEALRARSADLWQLMDENGAKIDRFTDADAAALLAWAQKTSEPARQSKESNLPPFLAAWLVVDDAATSIGASGFSCSSLQHVQAFARARFAGLDRHDEDATIVLADALADALERAGVGDLRELAAQNAHPAPELVCRFADFALPIGETRGSSADGSESAAVIGSLLVSRRSDGSFSLADALGDSSANRATRSLADALEAQSARIFRKPSFLDARHEAALAAALASSLSKFKAARAPADRLASAHDLSRALASADETLRVSATALDNAFMGPAHEAVLLATVKSVDRWLAERGAAPLATASMASFVGESALRMSAAGPSFSRSGHYSRFEQLAWIAEFNRVAARPDQAKNLLSSGAGRLALRLGIVFGKKLGERDEQDAKAFLAQHGLGEPGWRLFAKMEPVAADAISAHFSCEAHRLSPSELRAQTAASAVWLAAALNELAAANVAPDRAAALLTQPTSESGRHHRGLCAVLGLDAEKIERLARKEEPAQARKVADWMEALSRKIRRVERGGDRARAVAMAEELARGYERRETPLPGFPPAARQEAPALPAADDPTLHARHEMARALAQWAEQTRQDANARAAARRLDADAAERDVSEIVRQGVGELGDWLAAEPGARALLPRRFGASALFARSQEWHERVAIEALRRAEEIKQAPLIAQAEESARRGHAESLDAARADAFAGRWSMAIGEISGADLASLAAAKPETSGLDGEFAGWVAVGLPSALSLAEEGRAMSHCVGSYAPYCVEARSRIFSVRSPEGQAVGTLEIRAQDATDKELANAREQGFKGARFQVWRTSQFLGKRNARIENSLALRFAERVARAYTESVRAHLSGQQPPLIAERLRRLREAQGAEDQSSADASAKPSSPPPAIA